MHKLAPKTVGELGSGNIDPEKWAKLKSDISALYADFFNCFKLNALKEIEIKKKPYKKI